MKTILECAYGLIEEEKLITEGMYAKAKKHFFGPVSQQDIEREIRKQRRSRAIGGIWHGARGAVKGGIAGTVAGDLYAGMPGAIIGGAGGAIGGGALGFIKGTRKGSGVALLT